jgi:hypothetical protein
MVDADMQALGLPPVGHGQRILETWFAGWHQWSSAVTALYDNAQQKFE